MKRTFATRENKGNQEYQPAVISLGLYLKGWGGVCGGGEGKKPFILISILALNRQCISKDFSS